MHDTDQRRRLSLRSLAGYAGGVASGAIGAFAFPPFEWAECGWFFLVPLLVAASCLPPREALRIGWLAGFIFWLISIFWLTRVTVVGWLLLVAYCGLFTMPVAWFSSVWRERFGVGRLLPNLLYMAFVTVIWVGSEIARCTWFTGFPWNPTGASQYANIAFIQHARWGGVFAVTALLALANAAVAVTIMRYLNRQARLARRPHVELMAAMAVVVAAFVSGGGLARQPVGAGEEVRIALIQPSIAQHDKWTEDTIDMIYERLWSLTSSAVPLTRPDFAVWPETALPDDVRLSERSYDLVAKLAALGSPLLVGSMDTAFIVNQRPRFYNSSFLFDTNAVIAGVYEKRHLVLLGEYVPLHEHIRFITAMTPIMESFSPGMTSTVFRLPGRGIRFSSLICFEDTLPYLARDSVRNGARLLVNQTNDAWFDPWWASRQHMILAVFRAVENGVPMVRAANTGFTCAIDARGRIHEKLLGDGGRHDGPGFLLARAQVATGGFAPTFYTRHGDLFGWSCCVAGIASLLGMAWRRFSPTKVL